MNIPKFDPLLQEAINSWIEYNPEYIMKIYSGNDCRNYIKRYFNNEILHTFDKLIPYAYKADFMRLLILYNEGGIYSDMRTVCTNSLNKLFPSDMQFFIAKDQPLKSLFNGFIISIPKHEILRRAIKEIINNVKARYYGKNYLSPSGPCMLGKVAYDDIINKKFPHTYLGKLVYDQKLGLLIKDNNNKLVCKHKYLKEGNKKFNNGDWVDYKGNNYRVLYKKKQIYAN